MPAALQAQITVHTTLASWLAAVTAPGVDTYDDLDVDEGFYDTPLARTAGVHGYELSSPNGFVPVGVEPDVWMSQFFYLDGLTFSAFSSGVRGIGGNFFPTLENGSVSTGNLQVTLTSGAFTSTQTLTNPTASTFLGFTSTVALTSLTVSVVQPSQTTGPFATVNNLRLGAAQTVIPEPSTYALLATGLVAHGMISRRRRLV
ncbi:MAG: PEP-CTERM sorting domain-containing protein [Gemmatimonadaceae bacterium]|nr:PEP-CTERM sorting domain-containing protein [Gemmatimonadaceae bacterium]